MSARSVMEALMDAEEGPLLRPLLGGADPEARRRYAEWLVARQDPRGELMQLTARLADLGGEERAQALARIAALEAGLDEMWLGLLVRERRIAHCGAAAEAAPAVRFAFTCPNAWEKMATTGDAAVRWCGDCRRDVHRCDSFAEAEDHARRGDCIAVPGRLVGEASDRFCRLTVGRPDPVAYWGRHIFD